MLKPDDINKNVWNNTIKIGAEKIKFEGFTFDKGFVTSNPIMTLMLVLASDPTDKQKELLDLIDIVIEDDNGKRFYPREEEEKESLLVD